MEKNVIISIKGVQRLEDADPDTMELVTEGRLEQDGNSYTSPIRRVSSPAWRVR